MSADSKWEMTNIIGEDLNHLKNIYNEQNYSINIYGKKSIKPDRKMGHYTKQII